MVGLSYLKHTYDLSGRGGLRPLGGESILAVLLWLRLLAAPTPDQSEPAGPAGASASAPSAWRRYSRPRSRRPRGGKVDPQELWAWYANVDTTVQEKAIAKPLDSRLYHRGREVLVRLAKRYGLPLRQATSASASGRSGWSTATVRRAQNRRMQREIGRLKRFLGRVYRDVRRKLVSRPDLADRFAEPLALIARLLAQQRNRQGKPLRLARSRSKCLSQGQDRQGL